MGKPKSILIHKQTLTKGSLKSLDPEPHHSIWCEIKIQDVEKGESKSMASVDYFQRKLDDKRRLTIPAELRAEFASGVVVTRGFGPYLHLYSKDVWDQSVEPALRGDILDEATADKNVRLRMGKIEAELDLKQGRLTLEQHQLDYASLERDVVAVRAGSYWRLYSPKNADL